jgi:aminoglycoside phosphotransferase (APT) family kinase protein
VVESATKIRLGPEEIEGLVRHALGDVGVERVEELTDGYFNAAYRVDVDRIGPLVLKVAPPAGTAVLTYEHDLMRAEVEAMRLAGRDPAIPVPALGYVDLTRTRLPVDWFLMELAAGEPWNHLREGLARVQNDAVE